MCYFIFAKKYLTLNWTSLKIVNFFIVLYYILYASGDETHRLFVHRRRGQVKDVIYVALYS